MAETELILNTNLQTSQGACISCLSSETKGQDIGASGDFNAQFASSLKELSSHSGEVLPVDGKTLPVAIQPAELNNLKPDLQSLFNNNHLDNINYNTLSEGIDDTQQDISPEKVLNLQNQIKEIPVSTPELVLSLVSEQEQPIHSEINSISAIPGQLNDEELLPLSSTIKDQVISSQDLQADESFFTTGLFNNHRISSSDTLTVDARIRPITTNSSDFIDEVSYTSNPQKFDAIKNEVNEINNFIAEYLSEDNNSKVSVKNQIISSDVFQQAINLNKSDSSANNISITSGVDAYNNINSGSLTNRALEAPIPLLIKQDATSQQIQQSVDQSIEQNVKWLIANKSQSAKINVFPESLGQVNIALNLEDSNLKLNFIASSNVTKDLIEASVATLKSQFNENGINLQEVSVETRFHNQSNQDPQYTSLNDNNSNQFQERIDTSSENDDFSPHEFVNKSPSHYLLDAFV